MNFEQQRMQRIEQKTKQLEEEYYREINEAKQRLKSRSPPRIEGKEKSVNKESIREEKVKKELQKFQEQVLTHRPEINKKSKKLAEQKKEWRNVIDNLTNDIKKRNQRKEEIQKRSQSKLSIDMAKPIEKSTKMLVDKL